MLVSVERATKSRKAIVRSGTSRKMIIQMRKRNLNDSLPKETVQIPLPRSGDVQRWSAVVSGDPLEWKWWSARRMELDGKKHTHFSQTLANQSDLVATGSMAKRLGRTERDQRPTWNGGQLERFLFFYTFKPVAGSNLHGASARLSLSCNGIVQLTLVKGLLTCASLQAVTGNFCQFLPVNCPKTGTCDEALKGKFYRSVQIKSIEFCL